MIADCLVHQWLRERWLVAFVVPVAAIAEHVDNDGMLEFLPELGGHFRGKYHRLWVVAVGVKDRRLDQLGKVGWVRRRPRIARISRKADLIIDDEMHGAAGAVSAQLRQAEALRNNALACESGIAGNEERHCHCTIFAGAAELILLGAHLAKHNGVNDLEM